MSCIWSSTLGAVFPKFDPWVSEMFRGFQTHLRKIPFCICPIAVKTPNIWKMLFLLSWPDRVDSFRNHVHPHREESTAANCPGFPGRDLLTGVSPEVSDFEHLNAFVKWTTACKSLNTAYPRSSLKWLVRIQGPKGKALPGYHGLEEKPPASGKCGLSGVCAFIYESRRALSDA